MRGQFSRSKGSGVAFDARVRVTDIADRNNYEVIPRPSDGETLLKTDAPAVAYNLQAHGDTSMLEHLSKRRKIDSFFHHERTEALAPSLVRPTSDLEQANNIFYAQDIGRQYQLAVKDFNIQIRDGRIKAKDKQIAELETQLDMNENLLSHTLTRNQELCVDATLQSNKLQDQVRQIEKLGEDKVELQQYLQLSDRNVQDQGALLRILYKQLHSQRVELQSLKDERFVDHLLNSVRGLLGLPHPPQDPSLVFAFMRLPGELRNMVYKYALISHRPIDFWPMLPNDSAGVSRCTVIEQDLKQINGNLLRVSRQVHKETVGILYGCNRFRFSHHGSWTLMTGFLSHINTNCQYLTSISVKVPDCWVKTLDDPQPLQDKLLRDMLDMKSIMRKFGHTDLYSPTGPSLEGRKAFSRGCEILVNLPALRSFTVVVPHNEEIYKPAARYIANILTSEDRATLLNLNFKPASNPKRTFLFLRRPDSRSQIVNLRNLDNDVTMGRAKLASVQCGAEIKSGDYGTFANKVSYTIDGGEEEYDVKVPEYVEQPAACGFVLFRPFWTAKRLLGY